MEKTTWRFIDSGPADGAYDMAVDEALLTLCANRQAAPTLRVYSFSPRCLSLGRFQAPFTEIDGHQGELNDLDVVRRPSGGLAILHQGDLAYSVTVPTDKSSFGQSPRLLYSHITLALVEAIRALGANDVDVCQERSRTTASEMCFRNWGPYDVIVDGHKVMGSAQARRRGALLQHGSIRLAGNDGSDTGLSELLGRRLTANEVAIAVEDAFANVLNVNFVSGSLTSQEKELAQHLRLERYASDRWSRQR